MTWVSCGAPPALAVGLALALDDAAPSLRRHYGGFVATKGSMTKCGVRPGLFNALYCVPQRHEGLTI